MDATWGVVMRVQRGVVMLYPGVIVPRFLNDVFYLLRLKENYIGVLPFLMGKRSTIVRLRGHGTILATRVFRRFFHSFRGRVLAVSERVSGYSMGGVRMGVLHGRRQFTLAVVRSAFEGLRVRDGLFGIDQAPVLTAIMSLPSDFASSTLTFYRAIGPLF